MKKLIFIGIVSFLFITGLGACVKNQDNNAVNTNYYTPSDQNINDTNYQEMVREQSDRAAMDAASHPHVGGRR